MPQLGGQLSALYPEKYIYDVAGFPKIRAQELVDNLIEQMTPFGPKVVLEQSVENVIKVDDDIMNCTQTKKSTIQRPLLSPPASVHSSPAAFRWTEQILMKKETSLLYKRSADIRRRESMILGGGDSAVDWANMLDPISEVKLVHRRAKFRAHEHSVEQLEQSDVEVMTPYQVTAIHGDGTKIQQVELQEVKGDEKLLVDIDSLIVNYGFVSSLGPIKEWGLDIEKNTIRVNSRMETNIPGIYAAGDVATYDGKVKLIATGFGEAPTAVNNAKAYLDPDAKLQPGHSSHMF
ncbi:NAD(P)/FAD-dependent oxidoreductase [Sinobaca sp. H24]|uniref:NAD(P)/FAD-dependent oxidoreductase n=1 Tax=Sinobaca sp. H24 TaxID=2923376 RepID=UPI00207A88D5|nr:NAD(P)/FAD-dependent oxidoreductase [Sinobaca sp. H24]